MQKNTLRDCFWVTCLGYCPGNGIRLYCVSEDCDTESSICEAGKAGRAPHKNPAAQPESQAFHDSYSEFCLLDINVPGLIRPEALFGSRHFILLGIKFLSVKWPKKTNWRASKLRSLQWVAVHFIVRFVSNGSQKVGNTHHQLPIDKMSREMHSAAFTFQSQVSKILIRDMRSVLRDQLIRSSAHQIIRSDHERSGRSLTAEWLWR